MSRPVRRRPSRPTSTFVQSTGPPPCACRAHTERHAVQQVCIKALDANPAVNGRRVGKRSVEAPLKHCPCWRRQPRVEHVSVEGGARVAVGGVVEFGGGAILPELAQACNAVSPKAKVGAARLPDAAHDKAALLA
eukprot:scaffold35212_cov69-Phaeocystis_antarctica.AAC.14